MKVVIQRVLEAEVKIDGEISGKIGQGLLLYVCLESDDTIESVEMASDKIFKLRIFEDEKGKMNKNIQDAQGSILSISQFTLSWDGKKGHRPSFDRSMAPSKAKDFYEKFNQSLVEKGVSVETGRFGTDMKVSSINDGPVTFHLNF